MKQFTIKGKVWKYEGPASWYFVYVGDKESAALKKFRGKRVGWGYIPVMATIGKTSWKTTLFPTKEGPYLIAIKTGVRIKEGVHEGDTLRIRCSLIS